jgi:hypothetical protein
MPSGRVVIDNSCMAVYSRGINVGTFPADTPKYLLPKNTCMAM